ncbi:MAG: heavy metal translocating P-type ATPase [Dermatophilus congolensis]|nr:heavy metal translocating P-type ATPase [Dermatophilus congolensis]
MTCASCSSRVERKLNKLEGVEASVNLATEKAHVTFPSSMTVDDIIATVTKTGYTAELLTSSSPDQTATASHDAASSASTESVTGREPAAGPLTGSAGGWSGTDESGTDSDEQQSWFQRYVVAPSMFTRAIVATILSVPVVVIAMVPPVMHALGDVRPWIELLLTTPVYFWAAYPFHRAALINARHLATTMDTLVSIGISAAYWWSLFATLGGETGHLYFETTAVVATFLLIGRTAEARAKTRGKSALTSLLELGVKEVTLLEKGPDGERVERRTGTDALHPGSLFLVRPGEKVATDGRVVEGRSAIDASLVTGESMPVDVNPGDEVTGGTINASGALVVEATRVGSETTLAGITRLVEAAQTGKAPVQRLADRVSAVFVPVVMGIAVVALVGWLLAGHPFVHALSAAVAVLVIACPCALGLATPTALLVGTGRGAELGALIKGPEILESTRRVDTVLLDKTGTVTTGTMRVTDVSTAGKLTKTAALQTAASVEANSEHPVAVAIVEAARERGQKPVPSSDFESLPGAGAKARLKDTEVTIGRADLFEHVPAELHARGSDTVGTTVYLGWEGKARATITVTDEVRHDTADGLARLHDLGLTTYLLTGDNAATAKSVAAQVGIAPQNVIAEVRPEDKHAVVQELRDQGKVVAMVGDGVNDAAALAAADLGLAMGSGTDVAMRSADIVLMRTQVGAVADAIGLSRRTLAIIKQNLFWAFAYNVIGIPLAAFGRLDPMFAGGAMAASSVIVVLNSLRLRSYAREREHATPSTPRH